MEHRRDSPMPAAPAAPLAREDDAWAGLRSATPARIGLGRVGDTVPLRPVLDFQAAHAAARDAVHAGLDGDALAARLADHTVIQVHSAAPDRSTYLRRPDLGRALDQGCQASLRTVAGGPYDCVFIIADGLSAVAVVNHAVPVLERCVERLRAMSIAPVVIATQARVALGDAVGEAMAARLSVVLIGERPGLSVADSLGVYITYGPRLGRRDSERNCISNVHANGGLSYDEAARKICWLVERALSLGATGVTLKEAGEPGALSAP